MTAIRHDSQIATRIVFETGGGLGVKAVLDLVRATDFGDLLVPAKPLVIPPTSNELLAVTAHERLFHGGARGEGTYLRVSGGGFGGSSVRMRSCHALYGAVRSRLLAQATSRGLLVRPTSYNSSAQVNKPGISGRAEMRVRGQLLKVGDLINGHEIAALRLSFGGSNVAEAEKYTTLAMFADGGQARFGFTGLYKINRAP